MQGFFLSELFIERGRGSVNLLALMGRCEFVMIFLMVINKVVYTVINVCIIHVVYLKREFVGGSRERRERQIKEFMEVVKKIGEEGELQEEYRVVVSDVSSVAFDKKAGGLSEATNYSIGSRSHKTHNHSDFEETESQNNFLKVSR